ncbi:MAG TPA: hypothetical protein VJ914_05370 [Pseudonocardiaceae bacterium]|nr:hypothetical protein [Pseudonocardiaceae bacterium]
MTYEAHSSVDGYLDALRDPARIPVLGSAGTRLAELTELSDTAPRIPPGPVGDVLVLVPPGSAAAPIGAALAERVGGTFAVGKPGEARADHVVLMGLGPELSLELVLETLGATAALREAGRGEAALGVLSGRNVAELSWLIAKGLGCGLRVPPADAQLCVAPWGGQTREDVPGLQWLVSEQARADVLTPLLLGRRHGLVSFAVAGREHALVLPDTVVCGALADQGEPGENAPSCAFTGQCFRAGIAIGDVLPARAIQADVVFANSCTSWRPGHGLVADDYQLTNAFAHGSTAAFIGAPHRMIPDVRLNLLAHRAAAAGATAGQLGVLVNQQAGRRDVPHYLGLGIPWVVPVPAAGPVPLDRLTTLLNDTDSSADDIIRARLRRAGQVVQALRDLPLAGLLPAGGLAEIDAEVAAVAADLKRDPSRADTKSDSGERLLELVADAEFDTALDLRDFGQVSESALNEVWEDVLETTAVPGTERCPYCGGPTATVTGRHPAHPRVARVLRACHTCGPVLDLPADTGIRSITIDCPTVWTSPGTVAAEVTIHSAQEAEGPAAVVVQVAKSAARGLLVPEAQRLLLGPDGPARVRTELGIKDNAFAHHEHTLRAIVVAGGQVHSASRPVAIRPPTRNS